MSLWQPQPALDATEPPVHVIKARREWTDLCVGRTPVERVQIRYKGIGGAGEFAWVEIEIRETAAGEEHQ